MPWYKAGTVSVVQNSNAVIGTSTAFISNSRVGDAFRGPDGGWYEVTNIASDTAMSISPVYQGSTNSAGAYALAPMQGYVKDSADALRALVNQFGGMLAVLGETPTTAGVREALGLVNSDGLPEGAVNLYFTAPRAIAAPLTGLVTTTSTPVVATDSVLVSAGKLQAQVGKLQTLVSANVGRGYIDGLLPIFNSGSGFSIASGSAYIPGSDKIITLTSTFTVSGLSLPANSWMYVYLYDNAGTATIEMVTTAPSAPYSGTARTKVGDTSRRFVCALRTGAGGALYNFIVNQGFIEYRENISQAPFTVLTGGVATTPTNVNCSAVIPPTTQSGLCLFANGGSVVMFIQYPGLTSSLLQTISANSRFKSQASFDTNQLISYYNNSAGGGAIIQICGYGMDR